MKITIDFTPAVQQHAGLGRYAEELTRALVALSSGDEIGLFYTDPKGRKPPHSLDMLPQKAIRWSNKPWRMAALLSAYAHFSMDFLVGGGDVFHATDHLLPRLTRTSSVFTLHDLAFVRYPETHLPLNRWFLRLMMPFFLRQADAIISVSEYTKLDAMRYYNLDSQSINVIPEGVDPRFQPVEDPARLAEVRTRYSLPDKFILFVSTIEPRKNLVVLWQAYKALLSEGRNEGLVVVGKKGWLYQETMQRLQQMGLEDRVLFPGFVRDEDLPAIYSLAQCFCFPSLFEGFGLTPLEAMASGCPVVCSDSSSLPEVCGDATLLVPPTDVSAMTGALRRLLDDPELRSDLRGRGLLRAGAFTWQKAAQQTLGVYRTVAGK